MKFLLQSKVSNDENGEKDKMKDFCQRRIVVRNGSIEELTEMSAEVRDENAVRVWIPDSISILKSKSFHNFDRFLSISFESNSRLIRIKSNAFSSSSLESIVIPSTVQILDFGCLSGCKSLSSISFESNSQLIRIESSAFSSSSSSSSESCEDKRIAEHTNGSDSINVESGARLVL
jgi:hypothetical protein